MTKRVAIVGGGIAGVTAVWQVAKLAATGADVEAVLFEASQRPGGIVETVRESGFIVECGPDAWVTEKPWARELAEELGLGSEIIPSNDATRKTYILIDGKLVAMPDGMRMMVPHDLDALDRSTLFSDSAKAAFRDEVGRASELKAAAPEADESVADFVQRHFGAEVLEKIGAPLLSGVFGGDVAKLSVRAVMAPFVAMEREHGSLIHALQQRAARPGQAAAVFTTLRNGVGGLIDAMFAEIPAEWLWLGGAVLDVSRTDAGWSISTAAGRESFDSLMLAVPADVASALLRQLDPKAAALMQMDASSAVVAGFGFSEPVDLPPGFGFLVPPGSGESSLLAGTFVDQKFDGRVSEGCRLLRGFFGGATADRLMQESDDVIAALALTELRKVLGELPAPALTVVRRWPRALPQYAVGHIGRMAALSQRVQAMGQLWLLGNGYRGVGLPDLVRDARAAARECCGDLVSSVHLTAQENQYAAKHT
jgi:oxygen-dependent protoporphyrinogen oxidase